MINLTSLNTILKLILTYTNLPSSSIYHTNRAFRGLSGTYNVRANERDRAAPRDIECLVQFLDNTQHKFVVDRRSKGQALLDSVYKHLNLIETDFFGLKYLPQERHHQNRQQQLQHQDTTAKNEPFLNRTLPHSNSYSHNYNNGLHNIHHHPHHHNNNNSNYQHDPNSSPSIASLSPSPSIINQNDSSIHNNVLNESSITLINKTSNATTKPNNTLRCSNNNSTVTTSPIVTATSAITTSTTNPVSTVSSRVTGGSNSIHEDQQQQQTSLNTSNSNTNNDANQSEFIEERWLDPAKSIRKQYKSGPPFKFYFRVRFYVSDPSKLADDTTRNHLYLQLRQDILNNRLTVPTCSAILLASYILQSEFGDYRRELQKENYASNFKLLPTQNDDLKEKVIELHRQHKSLSSADAEYQFLEHAAKELDCYGVEFYDAKDQNRTNVLIGVSSNGIVVFKDNRRISQFSWAKIIKIMFKKRIFSIQLRRDEGESCDNFMEFNLLSNQACKSFWEECVAQHSFFRLHQPKSPPKKFFSFLNFSSKFQYNGKTEYQTMEESRKRSFSHFSRTLSKRYARRTLPIGRPSWSETTTTTQDNNSDALSSESSTSSSSNSRTKNASNLAESIKTIKKGLEKKDLISDFEKLSRKKEDESHEESRLMENIDKNRYQDILPYDSTRVPLNDSMTGDYINASFVHMTVPGGIVNQYIATQGPLSSTCDDFWQMIWEQNSSLIIMVTPLIEAGRVKCHKYWPDEKEEVRYGQIVVRNVSEKSKTATIDRMIQLIDFRVSSLVIHWLFVCSRTNLTDFYAPNPHSRARKE